MENLIFYVVYTWNSRYGCFLKDSMSFHTDWRAAIKSYNKTEEMLEYWCPSCGHRDNYPFDNHRLHKEYYVCNRCKGSGCEIERVGRIIVTLTFDPLLFEYNNRNWPEKDHQSQYFSGDDVFKLPKCKGEKYPEKMWFSYISFFHSFPCELAVECGCYIPIFSLRYTNLAPFSKEGKRTFFGRRPFVYETFHHFINSAWTNFKWNFETIIPLQKIEWNKNYFFKPHRFCVFYEDIQARKIQKIWKQKRHFLRWKRAIAQVNLSIVLSPHIPGVEFEKLKKAFI